MPKNKRESLIFTVMMCFFMVLVMSIYNVSLHKGAFSKESIQMAWLGFPIAYVFAMACDWFVVSGLAKMVAFKHILKEDSSEIKKAITVSTCMVVPMVIIMSMFGACEVAIQTGTWNKLLIMWLTNIPLNFIVALPLQLLVAGPLVRFLFRKAFPEGTILA